ncbi:I78 family peptidase inhibitor [Shimia ponticola]|uniref:I78 family peptidase inhibitor n=1 Tax=Shimia ponticola TaxID=2582893 RepID=UPI0011BDD043|nr:I78 family peptidase inhibitor [Shimia ponticola]
MRVLSFLSALLLLACTPDEDAGASPATKADTVPNLTGDCPAGELQGLIRKTYADGLVDYDGRIRVIPPGTAVTMDFLPGRLNIATDADGVIRRITCG